jgi:meiotic recombination protein REC8, fungi type
MEALARTKEQSKSAAQARKNAAYWILDQGIGGVAANFGDDHFPHPLSVFSGQDLLDALIGAPDSPRSSKRARSPSADLDEDEDGRRVRPRGEDEEEVGRGEEAEIMGFDDDGIAIQDDDFQHDIESEVGRQAPPSLKDQSSAMPWNASSRAGSLQRFGSAGPGISSSLRGPGGSQLGPPSVLSGRRSRLITSSPLGGKGARLPSLAIQSDIGSVDDGGFELGDDEIDIEPEDPTKAQEFEMYGPSAAVNTQVAAQSQWLKNTLEDEAYNFLSFLETQINDRAEEEDLDEPMEAAKSITLKELLPPEHNSKMVGAQALLHVLALTTWGLIEVEQEEAFGDIMMRVVAQREKGDEEVADGGEGANGEDGEGANGEDGEGANGEDGEGAIDGDEEGATNEREGDEGANDQDDEDEDEDMGL